MNHDGEESNPLVENFYSAYGRPSIDTVVLYKMTLIQYVFGIRSMRQTIKEIQTNMAYRWFLGFGSIQKSRISLPSGDAYFLTLFIEEKKTKGIEYELLDSFCRQSEAKIHLGLSFNLNSLCSI